jgi:hypothetical protein
MLLEHVWRLAWICILKIGSIAFVSFLASIWLPSLPLLWKRPQPALEQAGPLSRPLQRRSSSAVLTIVAKLYEAFVAHAARSPSSSAYPCTWGRAQGRRQLIRLQRGRQHLWPWPWLRCEQLVPSSGTRPSTITDLASLRHFIKLPCQVSPTCILLQMTRRSIMLSRVAAEVPSMPS